MDGCSFALTKEDYAIRDLFLGDAGATADFAAALALAASCNSPFATWLIETCDGANDLTSKAAVSSFLLSKKDWTAKAFGVVLSEDWDISLLREPASHGCAFAQAVLAFFLPAGDEKTEFARKSAFVGERNGLFIHGMCLCETDAAGAKRALRKAAELGHGLAEWKLCKFLQKSDPDFWKWSARVAKNRSISDPFVPELVAIASTLSSDPNRLLIGGLVKGHVSEEKSEILGSKVERSVLNAVLEAVALYDAQSCAARKAVESWLVVGHRLSVVRDVRVVIAKLIWESRWDGKYRV